MIVSASYRTDIPSFYGRWFMRRLDAGFCRVVNPYGGTPSVVSLGREDVDGFVFWTRNAAPFLTSLDEIHRRDFPFLVQFTLTGYPRALEPSVPPRSSALQTIRAIASSFGPRVLIWRYDPILITSLTPLEWHRENFSGLVRALAGHCDEVVLSFAHIYAKTRANTARAARDFDFSWCDPEPEEKRAILGELAAIGRHEGFEVSLCSQPDLLAPGLIPARCIDVDRLSEVSERPLRGRTKGNRPGCLCTESRDIGAYDSCLQGCVYCYAVRKPETAIGRHRAHDPESEFLHDPPRKPRAPGLPKSRGGSRRSETR